MVTPFVALWMARRPGERWTRRLATLWPLGAVVAVWAILWIMAMRGRSGGTIHFSPDAVLAAPVHLAQVFLGAEWSRHQPPRFLGTVPPLVPLALALTGIALVRRGGPLRAPLLPGVPGPRVRGARDSSGPCSPRFRSCWWSTSGAPTTTSSRSAVWR